MCDYLGYTAKMFPENSEKKFKTPSVEHLYDVNEEVPKLNEERKTHFHTLLALNLLSSKITRPDTLKALEFLYTRVKDTYLNDREKNG